MNNSELLERFRELEARLQKVNVELEGLRVAIKGRTFTEKKAETPTKVYEVGEYVRVKPYEDSDEFAGMVVERIETPIEFFYFIYGKDNAAITLSADMIEKWIAKKGEMSIFWDDQVGIAFIDYFEKSVGGQYVDIQHSRFFNCIPFLSEQQYKRHIGYEK